MPQFYSVTYSKHDDYMTPKSAWEAIKDYIPNKTIWEAFYGDGLSGKYLSDLGFQVIHTQEDFFLSNYGEVIISNPPFTKVPEILSRCKELNKPFILLMPSTKINTSYFRNFFKDDKLQLIIPRKRIHFIKVENGKTIDTGKPKTSFDCFYYCWKIDLPKDIIWLD